MKTPWKKYLNYLAVKLGSIRANPKQIAAGYAMGFLLGTLPLMGIRVGAALMLAVIFHWNKPATLIGVYHINPLTGPAYYTLACPIGQALLGWDLPFDFSQHFDPLLLVRAFWSNGTFLLVLSVGCLALAAPIALFMYWSSYKVILLTQKTPNHEIPRNGP